MRACVRAYVVNIDLMNRYIQKKMYTIILFLYYFNVDNFYSREKIKQVQETASNRKEWM